MLITVLLHVYHILVPSEAPQITSHSFTATSFTVSWNRESCLSRNGPDRYYIVKFHEMGSTQVSESSIIDINIQNISNRIFSANTLNPVTSYIIQVAYINTRGSSPNANLIISTFGLPCKYH